MKQRIVILYGGKSGEHEVSLQSAASVLKNLDRAKYSVRLIGITGDGRWYLQPDELGERSPTEVPDSLPIDETESRRVYAIPEGGLACPAGELPVECVIPVLHGPFGEDGTVQGLLDVAGVPYVGAGVLGSALGMDKELCKRIWIQAGLPVVRFTVIHRHRYRMQPEAEQQRALRSFELPLFVKPARVGSSVGITRVSEHSELSHAVEEAFAFDTKLLVEPAVSGQEIECSVLGNKEPRAFTLGEVIPNYDFYSYEAKYVDPDGAALEIPARLDEELGQRIKEIAVAAYRAADVEGLARVDFFVDATGEPLLNEINTIPGFTRISMFPMLCAEDGLPYAELLDTMIALAIERYEERAGLKSSYHSA